MFFVMRCCWHFFCSLRGYTPTYPIYLGILWMMYLNTSRETRNKGEMSAYSLFNENVEAFVSPSCLQFFPIDIFFSPFFFPSLPRLG